MCFRHRANLFFVLFILCRYVLDVGIAIDSITSSQSMKDPDTLSSKDGNFTLGFFTPQNSTKRYVGIWWKSESTVIWVANRDQPLNDSSGVVTISEDSNLVVLNGQKQVIWSTNVSNITSNASSQFSDSGKLVLTETTRGTILWDSFQQPSNSLLPSMKLSLNIRIGEKVELTSWKSPSNPSVGSFSLSLVQRINIIEVFIWNETRPFWRSGPWSGGVFKGIPTMSTYLDGFKGGDDGEGNANIYYTVPTDTEFVVYILNSQGRFEQTWWDDEKKGMEVTWTSRKSDCDVYGMCGPFASCNSQRSPICSCLKGFEPRNKEEWNRQNWTSGCVRRTRLKCERVKDQNTSIDTKEDGFLKLQMIKVPDFEEGSPVPPDICKSQCLDNCSCIAYSHDDEIGCMSWTENLLDIQQFSEGGLELYIRVANSELDKGTNRTMIITITVIIGTVILVTCAYVMWRTSNHPAKIWRAIKSARKRNNKAILLSNSGGETPEQPSHSVIEELSQVKLQELLLFDFERVATVTNNFHLSNKLGQGGFGPVYKGKLQDGQEIAVKRLSRASGQGLEEFMNEVVVISKLQHRNLVRLFGCCVEGDEKMLIYEYLPNKSLDVFVFDPSKSKLLDWSKRCSIIEGIARGLLYLHRDSRLRIIHRDLKASNILLDEEMNPKISDFGMARIFGGSEDEANTKRVVGTYGYMSPEYAMQGMFSEKSDVFSFGVLILEIVSGRRNSSFYDDEGALSLLGFAWIQLKEGNILSIIDQGIYDPSHHKDILRCIHIGLLCVQEHAAERPTMALVISMLNSEVAFLPPPSQPAFIRKQNMLNSVSSEELNRFSSVNTISTTTIHGR
ncbi:G-type lectin S-receptor-like serine/threonine-protein kinase At1g11300 [Cajanus cajan]|uniref:G-type lectin S-receptor-like serine/threonine-protein kinase At1g11300 n=1 Tax=Cajanus cajan TaxID=3821 RepID=UPI00098DB416|nr:G-type lectin S-receptor-like serine/threonine-protein kinase At1g11300 [Cajanus cajan]XP_029130275.1 G-type lectin S-receptor-like serine/threonine-protein kinase At1g11300 [Cajanus cajan]